MLDGLISGDDERQVATLVLTAMNDAVHVVEVDQASKYCLGDLANDVNRDRACSAVDVIQGAERQLRVLRAATPKILTPSP